MAHQAAIFLQQQREVRAMDMNEQEIRWAVDIRHAVEDSHELQNRPDLEYAHHALVSRGNLNLALARIQGMQYFRDEYKIHDTPEEGLQLLRQFFEKHPGFVLSVDYDRNHGHFVIVYDYAKRKPKAIDFPKDWRIHLGGFFYLFQAMQYNIVSMREGLVHICECEGMGWDNFSMEHVRRSFSDLYEHYPLEHKEISWIRTPMVANLLHAFMKPLIRPETRQKFRVGCNFYGYEGRIDTIFNIPNASVAQENLLQKLRGYLQKRYDNEQTFRLPDLEPGLNDNGDPTNNIMHSDNDSDPSEGEGEFSDRELMNEE